MAGVPFCHMAGPAHRSEPNSGGAVSFATSDNLNTWVLHPPVSQGGFGQLEVPQVFEVAENGSVSSARHHPIGRSSFSATPPKNPSQETLT